MCIHGTMHNKVSMRSVGIHNICIYIYIYIYILQNKQINSCNSNKN